MVSQSIHYLKEPSGSRLAGNLQGIFVAVALASVLAVVNAAQISTLMIFPFSQTLFRKLNIHIAELWWQFVAWLMVTVFKVKVIISGDPLPKRENVLLIANHQEMTDIPVLIPLAVQQECLGRLKWFAKYPLKFVPGPGWGMHFIDCVFLKRDWAKDQNSIMATFARIKNKKVPAWLIMFPEGTRITPDKVNQSRKFAGEKGLGSPENVLVPRTKGFAAVVAGLHDYLDAVYDVTIGYPDGIPTLGQFMRGRCPTVHMHVKRHDMKDVPRGEIAVSRFVRHIYQDKDRRLAAFKRDRRFT